MASYGAAVLSTMLELWENFDYPCGQRLVPGIEQEMEKLRATNEVKCSDEVAAKLMRVSPKTIDRLLAREKQVRGLRQNRNPSSHPLLYQKIPVKVAADWDTGQIGNLQVGERQEAGGQYTKCMIPKGRDLLTSAFARSKHWVSDEGGCSAAGNRR
ncbi:MAG: hypothetical protein EXQ52_18995 [Bryobacterales bacterium]|nr:hypothetical protein [Bryobacterales bacterium]